MRADVRDFFGRHSTIGAEMDAEKVATDSPVRTDPGVRLSLLWVFVTFNYLYCDLMGLMDPDSLRQYLAGNVNGLQITQGFLLSAALLMEIPIAMVVLSSVLPRRAARWCNIVAGTVMTLVQIGSLFMAPPISVFYAFYSTVEIACTAFVVWYAWCWHTPGPVTARNS